MTTSKFSVWECSKDVKKKELSAYINGNKDLETHCNSDLLKNDFADYDRESAETFMNDTSVSVVHDTAKRYRVRWSELRISNGEVSKLVESTSKMALDLLAREVIGVSAMAS